MATNKNQHFVPKCYMRAFAEGEGGRSISLYNLDRREFIHGAPTKNQCSGSYFYGQDERLEHSIQVVEGAFASTVKLYLNARSEPTIEDLENLKTFWILQHSRTEAAGQRMAEMSAEMVEDARLPDDYLISVREAVRISVDALPGLIDHARDLKCCLVKNMSVVPFVTGDDPAILTNRWHLFSQLTQHIGFGLGSAGALGLLPLSPSVLCLIYDAGVYSVSHEHGWIECRRDADARAFNEHQALNCRANIYFKGIDARNWLAEDIERVRCRRPAARHHIHYLARQDRLQGEEVFVPVSAEESRFHQQTLIHARAIDPRPSSWPSFLHWRASGSIFTDDTARGFLRRAEATRLGLHMFRRIRPP